MAKAAEYVTRAEFDALRADLEQHVPAFRERRLARERDALRDRLAAMRELPPRELLAALEQLRGSERDRFSWAGDVGRRLARGLKGDALRRALDLMPVAVRAQALFFEVVKPPKRVRVSTPKRAIEVALNDVTISEECAERAQAVGLVATRERASQWKLRGWRFDAPHGAEWVWSAERWALHRELDPATDRLVARGILTATPLTDEESRRHSLDLWVARGANALELPGLD